MPRWDPDARGRLAGAALDLYADAGFEQTTVAEIAARAGLTERTFFRHFADKREVLFGRSEQLRNQMVRAVATGPEAPPMDLVLAVLLAAGAMFNDELRDYSRRRNSVIEANADLREREQMKLAALAADLGGAVRQRGVPEPAASLTAETAMAVFRVVFERWVDETSTRSWEDLVLESLAELRVLVG
jgi:AcrR family transcriptional regulator